MTVRTSRAKSRKQAGSRNAAAGIGFTDIAVGEAPEHRIRFTSGQTICVESMAGDRWAGRYWSADGRINVPYEAWEEDAFDLRIDRRRLAAGWTFVSASEEARAERGARHFVVELANDAAAVRVKAHTLLDGTPVLTRWLEITNASDRPQAMTHVYPWAGKLWPGQNFTVGRFTQDIWACEGWFAWQPVPLGTTSIQCDKGQGFDDPFFIARNEVTGEYFIGHLAWSANWAMEFTRDARGLTVRIGPTAVAPQRVLAPGETIRTPAVHLGHVSGSLDDAVQAMHDHLRRAVLPIRAPGRDCLTQYLVPADQGYYKPFDEASAFKCADVAAVIGSELFILDAYWWDITPDWVPSAERFPRGLQPLIDHVRKKGMLFGLYLETEGGRGRISESAICREPPAGSAPTTSCA
jgi:alpha-galactosidase